MKRGLVAAVLAVVLAVLFVGAAMAAPLAGEPLPPPPEGSTALYDRFPLEAWTLDGAHGDDAVAREARLAINRLMLLRAWAVKLSIRMMEQALEHRPAQRVAAVADDLAAELRSLFWERDGAPWVLAGIVLAGIWATVLWFDRRPGGGWRVVLATGSTLVLTLMLLSSLGGLLRGLETVSDDLAGIGFAAATRPLAGTAGANPSALLGEYAWRTFVHDPWVAGEFTDAAAAEQYTADGLPGGAMLTLTPAQRLNRYQTLGLVDRERLFTPWGASQLSSLWLLAVTSLVAAGAWAVAVAALSGAILFFDFLLILLAVLSPVALLLALFPSVGPRLITVWGGRVVAAVMNKVLAALVLGIFTTLSVTLLSLSETGGWPTASLIQALLAVTVLRFRLYSPAAAVAALVKVRSVTMPTIPLPQRRRGGEEEPRRTESIAVVRHAVENLGPGDLHLGDRLTPARPADLLSGVAGEGGVESAVQQLSAELSRFQRARMSEEVESLSGQLAGESHRKASRGAMEGALHAGDIARPEPPVGQQSRTRPVALAAVRSNGSG